MLTNYNHSVCVDLSAYGYWTDGNFASGSWQWQTSGSALSYTNWSPSSDLQTGSQTCLRATRWHGGDDWVAEECDQLALPLCEFEAGDNYTVFPRTLKGTNNPFYFPSSIVK